MGYRMEASKDMYDREDKRGIKIFNQPTTAEVSLGETFLPGKSYLVRLG